MFSFQFCAVTSTSLYVTDDILRINCWTENYPHSKSFHIELTLRKECSVYSMMDVLWVPIMLSKPSWYYRFSYFLWRYLRINRFDAILTVLNYPIPPLIRSRLLYIHRFGEILLHISLHWMLVDCKEDERKRWKELMVQRINTNRINVNLCVWMK